ncbi:unnamed protein product, partial [Ilex paraguariensis]
MEKGEKNKRGKVVMQGSRGVGDNVQGAMGGRAREAGMGTQLVGTGALGTFQGAKSCAEASATGNGAGAIGVGSRVGTGAWVQMAIIRVAKQEVIKLELAFPHAHRDA